MASKAKVRIVLATTDVYELELTPPLEENLRQLGNGFIPGSNFLQVHDVEWINLNHVVSYSFYEADIDHSGGGRVFDASKTDEGWKPGQRGGVVTAEPDALTQARIRGEIEASDGGGDMV